MLNWLKKVFLPAVEDIDVLVCAARGSSDAKEGITARLEKRAPVFTGT